MALIKCTECWNNVSEKAENCPHCRAKIKEEKKRKISFQTICATVTSILSVYVAIKSCSVSKQALEVSQIALKSTSSNAEPILDIDVDWDNDIITIKHETHDIYRLRYVYFGKINTYAIMTDDQTKISAVEIEEERTGQGLESVNIESFNCTEEEAKKLNKEMQLSLYENQTPENSEQSDELKEKIVNKIHKSKNIIYWEMSDFDFFDYRYIEIYYDDIYGNTRSMYYIYNMEYGFKTWRIHKLSKKQYTEYTNNIINNLSDKELLEKLFSKENFEEFEKSKYYDFSNPYRLSQ